MTQFVIQLYFGQFLEFLSDSQGQWKHLRHQYKIYWDTFRPAGAKRVVHLRSIHLSPRWG